MSPIQASLFDPALLTTDGMPRDCPCCKGTGWRYAHNPELDEYGTGLSRVACKNCAGTGRAVIPY